MSTNQTVKLVPRDTGNFKRALDQFGSFGDGSVTLHNISVSKLTVARYYVESLTQIKTQIKTKKKTKPKLKSNLTQHSPSRNRKWVLNWGQNVAYKNVARCCMRFSFCFTTVFPTPPPTLSHTYPTLGSVPPHLPVFTIPHSVLIVLFRYTFAV